MKIIGAGLSKTGTTTLAHALKILDHNVHHFVEQTSLHRKQWHGLYLDGIEPDFAAMYKDVDAVADIPAAFWFEEIFKAYPDAKVILTVRENADVWVQSFVKHMALVRQLFPKWRGLLPTSSGRNTNFVTAMRHATWGSESLDASFLYKKKYREHNERVQAVIPASQLLVFNVKEGWGPLCEFLGCEVPSQEFPRSNVGGSDLAVNSPRVKELQREIMKDASLLIAFLVAVAAIVIFVIAQLF